MRVCPRCSIETHEAVCPEDGAETIGVQDAPAPTYPAGTLIAGRYRVEGVIGLGGFGAVYRCTQLNMNQVVAVKILRSEHLTSVEHVKRFTREAQAVSKLKHPNTIHIFDFGAHEDGALFLAMEYLEGETLGHRLDRTGTMSWETLLHIMIQVCHSLTEAHNMPLVHRDLKPENIMLLPVAGDPNFVKLLDFGIAKIQSKETSPSQSQLTESGMIMGTPTYMSPEQAKGDPIDGRSDLYSLGIMMYEALTGRPPFQGDTPMTVLVAHIKDPPAAMPRDGSIAHVPASVERAVLKCLEKDPDQRPQSALALVELLGLAKRAAAESGATAVTRNPLENLTTMGMEGVDTATVLSVNSPSSLSQVQDQPVQTPARVPAPPSRAPLWMGLGAVGFVAVAAVAVALLADKPASAPVLVSPAPAMAVPQPQVAAPAVIPAPIAQPPTVVAPAAAPVAEVVPMPPVEPERQGAVRPATGLAPATRTARKSAPSKAEPSTPTPKAAPAARPDKPEVKPIEPRPHTAKPHGDNDFRIDLDGEPPANAPKH